jgi:2-keto-4-pentenoate hydratase
MAEDRVAKAAALLLEARRSGRALASLPEECRPRNEAEAYAIQAAVAQELGPIHAWKTGASSPTAEPSYAPILTVAESPAQFASTEQRLFGIEAEVAFRFARDLPPRATPYDRDEVVAAIGSLHPAIELVESRFADWTAVDALSKVADNQSNGALIFGPAIAEWRHLDLVKPPITVFVDAEPVKRSLGNNGGDPLRMVTALANYCAATQGGLGAGTLVTSGSITGVDFARAGARVVADFGPLGSVQLDFKE